MMIVVRHLQFEGLIEAPDWHPRYAILSSSISNVGLRLLSCLIFVSIPVMDMVVPLMGVGFFAFHFFDSESMKQEIGQSKTV